MGQRKNLPTGGFLLPQPPPQSVSVDLKKQSLGLLISCDYRGCENIALCYCKNITSGASGEWTYSSAALRKCLLLPGERDYLAGNSRLSSWPLEEGALLQTPGVAAADIHGRIRETPALRSASFCPGPGEHMGVIFSNHHLYTTVFQPKL